MGERLTKRNKDGTAYYPRCFEGKCIYIGKIKDCSNCDFDNAICTRLAAYEDLGTVEELAELVKAKQDGRLYIINPNVKKITVPAVDISDVKNYEEAEAKLKEVQHE